MRIACVATAVFLVFSFIPVFNVQRAKGIGWLGPSEVICELNWTADLSLVPEYIRNDPSFAVSYEGNDTTIEWSSINFTENETVCIILETPSFYYPHQPPRAGGFEMHFQTSVDPKEYYNVTQPDGQNRTVSRTSSLYNAEVNLTSVETTFSIWDAEWWTRKVFYLSSGYNASMLLDPINLSSAENRLITPKQSYGPKLTSTDLYWAYRMGYVSPQGFINGKNLSEALFPQPGNCSFKQYVYVAPYSASGSLQPVSFNVTVAPIRLELAPQHDLGADSVVIEPAHPESHPLLFPGQSALIAGFLLNYGQNDETDAEALLYINDTVVNSTTFAFWQAGEDMRIYYEWIPTVVGIYNLTVHVRPASGETYFENNLKTLTVTVANPRIKSGDIVRYDYTYSGTPPPENERATWELFQFLSFEGSNATVRLTRHFADGSEQNQTLMINVFYGFILAIPPNSLIGDRVEAVEYHTRITILGETTASYTGLNRTVVYANFTSVGSHYAFVWDKETGILLESRASLTGYSVTSITTDNTIIPEFPAQVLLALLMLATASVTIPARKRTKTPSDATLKSIRPKRMKSRRRLVPKSESA